MDILSLERSGCHVSYFAHFLRKENTLNLLNFHLVTPPLSTVGWLTVGWLKKPKKVKKKYKLSHWKETEKEKRKIMIIVSSLANISDTPFNQKSPLPPEEGVLNYHTQTYRHLDIATI